VDRACARCCHGILDSGQGRNVRRPWRCYWRCHPAVGAKSGPGTPGNQLLEIRMSSACSVYCRQEVLSMQEHAYNGTLQSKTICASGFQASLLAAHRHICGRHTEKKHVWAQPSHQAVLMVTYPHRIPPPRRVRAVGGPLRVHHLGAGCWHCAGLPPHDRPLHQTTGQLLSPACCVLQSAVAQQHSAPTV